MPLNREHRHAPDVDHGANDEREVIASGAVTARSLESRFGAVFNVMDFGATADGTTDDSAAINLAFAAAKAAVNALPEFGTPATEAEVYFPPGRYRCNSPVNATQIRGTNWLVNAHGAVLDGHTPGKAVFDLVGSRFCTLRGITITGGTTDTPRWGIQMGRYSTENSDFHAFQQVTCLGHFTGACLYNYCAEDSTFVDMRLWNESLSRQSYCMVMDGTNDFAYSSDYVTITAAAGLPQSFISNIFISLDGRKRFSGPYYHMKRTSGFRFYQCYGVSHDDAVMTLECDGFGHRDLFLDMHMEGAAQTYAVLFKGDGSEVDPTINGFSFRDGQAFASTAVFRADAGLTTLTIKDYDIRVRGLLNSPLYFDDNAKFKLYGGYMHIASASRMEALAEMVGTIVTDDRDLLALGPGSQFVEDASNLHMAMKGSLRVYDDTSTSVAAGGLGNAGECRLEAGHLVISDGITAPSAETGLAKIYVDEDDGDLKVIFGDGTVTTIAMD